jgi:hypothetical protein
MGELIHEFVEVADFLHKSILHFLYFVSTDRARDEGTIRMEFRFIEKGLEVDFLIENLL